MKNWRGSFFLGALALLFAIISKAQALGDSKKKGKPAEIIWDSMDYHDVSVTAGVFLPFGIVGVRSNYPMWGALYSHPSVLGQVEYQFYSVRAEGVILYNGGLGLRWDFRLFDALDGFFGVGADVYYYQRKRTSRREFPFNSSGGSDLKWGAYFPLAGNLRFRSDFKFNLGPGKTFYVGLGLQYRFSSDSK